MPIKSFLDLKYADPETGLIAVGGDLSVQSLLLAYRKGIFPWPVNEQYLTWFAPEKRAVLFLDDFRVSKSTKRYYKQGKFDFKINNDFLKTIEHCASLSLRKKDTGTWITDEIIEGYYGFYKKGYAYSVEAYNKEKLVGGFYGVTLNGFISAESMFHIESNASKLALYYFIEKLKEEKVKWIDFQAINSFTESVGAKEIDRDDFMKLLEKALKQKSFSLF